MSTKIFKRPRYLKKAIFHYCAGCGHSVIHRLIAEVIEEVYLNGDLERGVPNI